jgi:hypothetical protein
MTHSKAVVALALLGVVASAQEPRPTTSDPTTLTKVEITAEAQRRLAGLLRPDVRVYDGFAGPAERAEAVGHVLLAETPDRGLVTLRTHHDVLRLIEPIDSPERALAFVRFLSTPPVGEPLLSVVTLLPRIETEDAIWVFSPVAVETTVGQPRITGDAEQGFAIERVALSLQKLRTARQILEPVEGELAPEQSLLIGRRGVTTHLVDAVAVLEERVGARSYDASMTERPAKLWVVRVPKPVEVK